MIEVKNLVKKYGDKAAVENLSFSIKEGEVVGLLGLNGAGKSTTMNCLTGYIAPTEGSIQIGGYDILKDPNKAKKIIGYLPEVFSFYTDMRIVEYLDYVCDIKGFTKDKQVRKEHIEAVCRQTGISDLSGRMIRNLSKGYKQRVGFAQALIGNPKVIILDEPTVGLDPSQIIEIRQLIKDSGKESTVIVSSHILSEIQAICSRIILIHEGRIAFDGPIESIGKDVTEGREVIIRVKGNFEDAGEVLKAIPDVQAFHLMENKEPGCVDISVEGKEGTDIRELIFKGFSEKGMALLQLYGKEISLENTFLQLTGQEKKGRVKK